MGKIEYKQFDESLFKAYIDKFSGKGEYDDYKLITK